MTDTENYQEARANYYEMPYLRMYKQEPDTAPCLLADIAPFPVWLVPPGWRLARLCDVADAVRVAGASDVPLPDPENAAALLAQAGITYAPTIDPLGMWGWSGALVTWEVLQTGDTLVLWRVGSI